MPIFTCILTYNLNRNWSFFFNFFLKKTFHAILFLVCLPPSPDHTPPPRVEKGAVRSNSMPPSSLESFSHAQTSTYNTPSPPSPPPFFFLNLSQCASCTIPGVGGGEPEFVCFAKESSTKPCGDTCSRKNCYYGYAPLVSLLKWCWYILKSPLFSNLWIFC